MPPILSNQMLLSFIGQKKTALAQSAKASGCIRGDCHGFKKCLRALFPSGVPSATGITLPATPQINDKGPSILATLTKGKIGAIASVEKAMTENGCFSPIRGDQEGPDPEIAALQRAITDMVGSKGTPDLQDGILITSAVSSGSGEEMAAAKKSLPREIQGFSEIDILWFPGTRLPGNGQTQKTEAVFNPEALDPIRQKQSRTGRIIDLLEQTAQASGAEGRQQAFLFVDQPNPPGAPKNMQSDHGTDSGTIADAMPFAEPLVQKFSNSVHLSGVPAPEAIETIKGHAVSDAGMSMDLSIQTPADEVITAMMTQARTGEANAIAPSGSSVETKTQIQVMALPATDAAVVPLTEAMGSQGIAETLESIVAERVRSGSGRAKGQSTTLAENLWREAPGANISEKWPLQGELEATAQKTTGQPAYENQALKGLKASITQPSMHANLLAGDAAVQTSSALAPEQIAGISNKEKNSSVRSVQTKEAPADNPYQKTEKTAVSQNQNSNNGIFEAQKNEPPATAIKQGTTASPADEMPFQPPNTKNSPTAAADAKEPPGSLSADRSAFSEMTQTVKESRAAAHESLPGHVIRQVGRQIVKAVHNGEQVIRMTLKPPELGSLKIEMAVKDNVVNLGVNMDNPVSKELLLTHIHELRETLGDQGIKLEKVDVQIDFDFKESFADSQKETQDERKQRNGATNGAFESQDSADPAARKSDREGSSNRALDLIA